MLRLSHTYHLLFVLLLFFPGLGEAQDHNEIRFIRHLMDQQFWKDALYAIGQFEENETNHGSENEYVQDTLHFWAGWSAYHLKQLPTAIRRFDRVSENHPLHIQATFYKQYLNTYYAVTNRDHELLQRSIHQLGFSDFEETLHKELQLFQLAGMNLLNRDFDRFYDHAGSFSGSYHAMAGQQDRLKEYASELQKAGNKSPFVAALMSAVIPGSGKVYAGRRGSGIGSFFQVAVFGGMFAESLLRAGTEHPRTWITGCTFGIFYLANIRGSALAVRITKEEIYEHVDQHILFDLHIPLRNIFR